MDRAKPFPERDLRIFEDGSDQDREPIALRIAGLTLPIELGKDINLGVAAPRASDVVVPTTARQISLTGPIVRKGRFELQKCHQLKANHFTVLFADTGRTPEGGLRHRPGSRYPPRCCSARLAGRSLIECLDRGALLIIPWRSPRQRQRQAPTSPSTASAHRACACAPGSHGACVAISSPTPDPQFAKTEAASPRA
jgi:hypothetical protein